MRHEETTCSTAPARFAARRVGGPGFGHSATRVHACSCGLEVQGAPAMAAHLEKANRLVDAMNDPTLPLVVFE